MSITRFPKGVSTAVSNSPLQNFVLPDITKTILFWDDFYNYDASHWVVTTTEAGVGSATEAIQDEVGGVLLLTNDAADNDNDFLQWAGEEDSDGVEIFKITTSERAWFKARFKVSDATQSDFVIGLQVIDTAPLDTTDGIFFQKDDGDTNLDFHVEKNSTQSSLTGIHTMVDATYVTVGFYYDKQRVHVYVDDAKVGDLVDDNLPDDTELTISFGIQNGAAAAKTMSIDYILAAQDRP